MLETYYSSGHVITKAIGHFTGLRLVPALARNQSSVEIGSGFSILSNRHPLSESYAKLQTEYGYEPKHGMFIAHDFGKEVTTAFYDDPYYQLFLRLGLAASLGKPHKVLPHSFAVLNDSDTGIKFYRPRNYLAADDFNTLSLEGSQISLKALRSAIALYRPINDVMSKDDNSRIGDALTYYTDYLRETDPKLELVILTMILEVLFIEDGSSTELQTKLMTRLARFLKPKPSSQAERAKLSEFIKTIYNIRSRVLHGADYRSELASKAKKAAITPNQYLTDHIQRLDDVVMTVLKSIVTDAKLLILMKSPRKSSDETLRDFFRQLLLG